MLDKALGSTVFQGNGLDEALHPFLYGKDQLLGLELRRLGIMTTAVSLFSWCRRSSLASVQNGTQNYEMGGRAQESPYTYTFTYMYIRVITSSCYETLSQH